MNKKLFFILNLTLLLSLVSCEKEKNDLPKYENDDQLIVLNQGNYTEQNGSISLYSETKNSVVNRAFKKKNGFDIGATIMGGTMNPLGGMYLICSNPSKIMIMDGATLECYEDGMLEDYPGFVTPRYITNDGSFLYITVSGEEYEELPDGMYEYTDSKLFIVSMANGEVVKVLDIGSDAEGIICRHGFVFVAHRHGISVISGNGAGAAVMTTIDTEAYGPVKHFAPGSNDRIYVSAPEFGILSFDPYAHTLQDTIETEMDYEGFIHPDATGSAFYYYVNSYDENWNSTAKLNRFQIASQNISTLLTGTYFYSVGVSPFTGNIYTSETDFTTNSTLKVLNANGNLKSEHEVGVGAYRYLYISYGKIVEE